MTYDESNGSHGNNEGDDAGPGDEDLGDFFAPPAFKPDAALIQLKRALRDRRELAERGNGFSFEGQEVLALSLDDGQLIARLARKPARSPEWDTHVCRSAADVRKLQDELQRRLRQWNED